MTSYLWMDFFFQKMNPHFDALKRKQKAKRKQRQLIKDGKLSPEEAQRINSIFTDSKVLTIKTSKDGISL